MDSIFIFGLMLVLFGPKKLPEIARQAGKLMMEFRRASNEFKMQMEDELRASEQSERQSQIDAETRAAIALTAATTATTASLPDGSTVQLASDGTTEPVAPPKYAEPEPSILPPSVGETVSTSAPNLYRPEPPDAAPNATADATETPGAATPPAAEPASAEDFYAQREGELREGELRESELREPALQPASAATPGVAAEETALTQAFLVETAAQPAIPVAVTTKQPGTEMYPDTAPMAESEQAPIHHV